jgi:hypothetical protein
MERLAYLNVHPQGMRAEAPNMTCPLTYIAVYDKIAMGQHQMLRL